VEAKITAEDGTLLASDSLLLERERSDSLLLERERSVVDNQRSD
jgi:hypothetical protein